MAPIWSSLKILVIVLLLPIVCPSSSHNRLNLKLFTEWKEIEFKFPASYLKKAALEYNIYVRGNSIPIDIDVWYKGPENRKIFVTFPKFATGIPVTLGYITKAQTKDGPKLKPYPDFSWHWSNGTDCDGLTSVQRIAIDKCNRIWVLDSGQIARGTQGCTPQILAFDLKTDQLLHRYRIPASQYTVNLSRFATPIVDVRDSSSGNCEKTMIYMADNQGFGVVVYDVAAGVSWRVENPLMNSVPSFEFFTISGESFNLRAGITGMTISPNCIPQNERLLYFNALASGTENTIPLRILDNKSNWDLRADSLPQAFTEIGSRGIQSPAEAMDRNGNLFFGICWPNAIVCWDSSTPYTKANLKIVAQNEKSLQWAGGLKIITNSFWKQELWILTNRYQKFETGTLQNDEVNFRILYILVDELLDGTKCKGTPLI